MFQQFLLYSISTGRANNAYFKIMLSTQLPLHMSVNSAKQAAAHGVPTVATKNGGPVDIMKTLHHGVTVDPTDSKQLGNALLSILTNPTQWEQMSKSGMSAYICESTASPASKAECVLC